MAQNDPKWPKVAQIWPKMALEWPKMIPSGPKMTDDVVDSDVDDVNGWISGPLRGSDANKKKDSGRKSDSSKFLFFMTSHDDNDESLWVDDDVDTGNQ